MLLASGQPELTGLALGWLDRLLATAEDQDRTGSVIEIRALRALVLARGSVPAAAVHELAGTLALASAQGHVRVFADEGTPMTALLDQVAAAHRDGQAAVRQVPLGYLARVLRAAGPKAGGPKAGGPKAAPPAAWRSAGAAVPGLVEPLTSREMEVLYLLAAGSPNQLIAESLVVTLDTVKKHVTHVLGKLGAANRTEAVARARELGLIA